MDSLISLGTCPKYWCAVMRFSRYFLDSERMEEKIGVAKFWHSSMLFVHHKAHLNFVLARADHVSDEFVHQKLPHLV